MHFGLDLSLTSILNLNKGGGGVFERSAIGWGDSLTAGAGASGSSAYYPTVAAGLFDPPRTVVNRGRGGQTSTQIAARQGGVPILVTLTDNIISPMDPPSVHTFDFNAGGVPTGWGQTGSGGATVTISDGKLLATSGSNANSGARWLLPVDIAIGDKVRLQATVSDLVGATTVTGGMRGGGSGWNGSPGLGAGARTIDETYTATRPALMVDASPPTVAMLMNNTVAGNSFKIDDVTISITKAVTGRTVTYKSVNILTSSGNFSGTQAGTILGVHGVMSTDTEGNWTFTRDAPGLEVVVPTESQFVPDDAVLYRSYINWLWAGRNNPGFPATVKSDIAAMIAFIGHGRYLVGSILTSTADSTEMLATIVALNVDLAALYGPRFVDLYAILRASGDGSDEDNADIAAGFIPRSLRVDSVHLNDAGYAIVAQAMVHATLAMGW